MTKPTTETYRELDRAYAYFNKKLFGGKLPTCLITMQRKKGARGYFWADTWTNAAGELHTDEIALNPDQFRERTVREVLSTLVHEQCHLQQQHFGKPSRNGYHNSEWGRMMEDVGLVPSATGEPGGAKTGQRMTHYIETGGKFDKACEALIASGYTIPWLALTGGNDKARAKKAASKTKFTCPECEQNAWAKADASLMCGHCEIHMIST